MTAITKSKIPTYILVVDPYQANDVREIKSVFSKHKVIFIHQKLNSIVELLPIIRKIQMSPEYYVAGILLSYTSILRSLIAQHFSAPQKLGTTEAISTNYQGALFEKKIGKQTYPIVILPEMKSFVYKKTGKFLADRFFSKLYDPKFPRAPKLNWEMLNENNAEKLYNLFKHAVLIGGDIETENLEVPYSVRNHPDHAGIWLETSKRTVSGKSKTKITGVPRITLSGYTGVFKNEKGIFESYTIVIPIDSMENVRWMRKFNALPAPKIYQNGKYDIAYFLRYNAPLENFLYDTLGLAHSWYAELPKTLDFLSAMFIKNHMYWKDESSLNKEYYNAQDCHNMTWVLLFMLQQIPEWALNNYKENFPKIFPSISANMQGIKINKETMKNNLEVAKAELKEAQRRLEVITNTRYFNGNSSNQVVKLMEILGYKSKKSDKAAMRTFRDLSELNEIYASAIDLVREKKKAISNYFEIDLFNGRFMYSIDPFGTETGRAACRESEFWCGGNLQNIPYYAKSQFIPDEGWKFGARDYSQSESRWTAYMSEDLGLIDAVENSEDFHVTNAARFFGIPVETIMGYKETDPALFKTIRNAIGKKINHGANYNMGPYVLLQNMGAKAVLKAARTLKLSPTLSLQDICAHLLSLFDKAYPLIRDCLNPGSYYYKVIKEIEETRMLVGPMGWTRYCFGDPSGNKLDLNSYVAHGPQSASVKKVNKAWFQCWEELEMGYNGTICRFLPQIHDEIFFMYKEEHEEFIFNRIKEIMESPEIVNGRTLIVPTDAACGYDWSKCK